MYVLIYKYITTRQRGWEKEKDISNHNTYNIPCILPTFIATTALYTDRCPTQKKV